MISAIIAVTSAGSVDTTDIAYGNIASSVDASVQVAVVTKDTEAVVREYFSDIPVLIEVARCESRFRHTLEDGSVLRGKVDNRDTGVMQINTYYHAKKAAELGLDVTVLEDNMAYARHLYEKQGTAPWQASSTCWGRTLASV